MKKIVIVSHSGGLDSSVLITKAISMGYDVQPIKIGRAHVWTPVT